jgi:hypothetical protein
MADIDLQSAVAELQRRGVKVGADGQPLATAQPALPPEANQGIRPLQRALAVKQLTGAIDVQDALNELNKRGVKVKLANADLKDKAQIAKDEDEAQYIVASLHPDPAVRAENLAKKNARDLEKAYSESIGDLPEQFQDSAGITPAPFEEWYAATVEPRILERVNTFQGSDQQRAQFETQLREASLSNAAIQEQYRMYSTEAKMRPATIARGTPEYYDKLRSDLTAKLQERAVLAARVKAIPGILENQAKAEAEAPQRQQKAVDDLESKVQQNATLKKFREQMGAVNLVQSLGTKPNPTNVDDLGLIYAYVKLLDPGSVVREGEIALARKATPLLSNLVMTYNRLHSDSNGLLDATTRQNYLEAAHTIAEGVKTEVAPELERFEALANERGVPLEKIFNAKELPLLRSSKAAPARPPTAAPGKASIRIQNGFRYQLGSDGRWTSIGPS